MKISSIVTGACLALGVHGFADTGVFFSSQSLGSFEYIEESSAVAGALEAFTENVCQEGGIVTVYRVKNLQNGDIPLEGSFIKHVHYSKPKHMDLSYGGSCNVEYLGQNDALDNIKPSSVVVIDLEDDKTHTIGEFLTSQNVIVQGKPSFHKAGKLDEIREYIGDKYSQNHHKKQDFDSEDDYFKAVEELEQEFRAAESFIAQEGDGYVTALESPKATNVPVQSQISKPRHSSLFTEYQFFTPGIFSCLLVSFFLLSILYVALNWIGALEISYHAFEKQVDFDKKNE